MKQLQTAHPGADGKPDLSGIDAAALFAAALPAILTVVLKGHILADFKKSVVMPAVDALKVQLETLFHSGGQSVTAIAGILPEVGGIVAGPIMASIGAGFTLLMAKFAKEVSSSIGCVLDQLAADAIKKVSVALKPGIDFIKQAEHELMAYIENEFAFMVPIVQHIFQVVIPTIAAHAGPGVRNCMNLLWSATGQPGQVPEQPQWHIPPTKPPAIPTTTEGPAPAPEPDKADDASHTLPGEGDGNEGPEDAAGDGDGDGASPEDGDGDGDAAGPEDGDGDGDGAGPEDGDGDDAK